MAFEIGPREQVQTYTSVGRGRYAHSSEIHSRVINGTKYVFGRFTYDSGKVAIQVIIPGTSSKANPDIHYWTNREED